MSGWPVAGRPRNIEPSRYSGAVREGEGTWCPVLWEILLAQHAQHPEGLLLAHVQQQQRTYYVLAPRTRFVSCAVVRVRVRVEKRTIDWQ